MNRRNFPEFLTPWRNLNGENFTPTDHLGQGEGIEFAISAQWLFCPNFIEYRGGLFASDFENDLNQGKKKSVDEWLEHFSGNIARAESKGNLTIIHDIFSGCDTTPYEDDLFQLTESVAECWRGLLKLRFPDREFVVDVYDDENSYGPQLTFYSASTPPKQDTTVVYDLPAGHFPATWGVRTAVHVDLPPSLRDEFAALAPTPPQEVDVRAIRDLPMLLHAISPGASTVGEAINRSRAETIVFTKFEQLWVKNHPVAEQLLTDLPSALRTARNENRSKHIALTDLASRTADAALVQLNNAPKESGESDEPVVAFHYPPSA